MRASAFSDLFRAFRGQVLSRYHENHEKEGTKFTKNSPHGICGSLHVSKGLICSVSIKPLLRAGFCIVGFVSCVSVLFRSFRGRGLGRYHENHETRLAEARTLVRA